MTTKKVIAHTTEFKLIVDSINRETRGSIPQGYYISAIMGMGKTHLLHQIKEVFNDRKSFTTLFIDCLLNPMLDFSELQQKLLSVSSNKRIILLLDEFHTLLSKWDKESLSGLRAMIFSEDAPIMITAGIGIPPQLTEYNEPLYDSLSLMTLKEISSRETIDIIKEKITDMPATFIETLKDVYNVIGGTPLVASLLAESIQKQYVTLSELTRDVLASLTPYYKALLYNLSPIQRKIVLALLQSNETVPMPKLRELTGLKSSDLTAQLLRLNKNRIVYTVKVQPKKSHYIIYDKLFRQWYRWIYKNSDL